MTDERYKKIMADLGMPNSRSLLAALQQVANEAGQECAAAEREACAAECERMMMYPGGRQESAAHNNVWAAAKAIRERSNASLSGLPHGEEHKHD